MPTKPLYTAPAKPRGLESISINREEFIKLLREEKARQAGRMSKAKRAYQKRLVDILSAELKKAREGKQVGRQKYSGDDYRIIELPKPPVFSPCDYDLTIKRLTHDKREDIVLSAGEWNSFFPCDVGD